MTSDPRNKGGEKNWVEEMEGDGKLNKKWKMTMKNEMKNERRWKELC